MIQLPKVLTGYFSTSKLNSALTLIEDWFNNNVIHRKNGSAVMEQDLDMNGNSIINTVTGTDPSSLVNKNYVDQVLPAMEASAQASAQAAAASATDSANSATAAATSAANASTSEATTLNYLKEFRDTYLGSYSSAPATDPDGNPVNTGDLYFDTTLNEMRVYDASGVWKSAGSTVNGTSKRLSFTGDGSTTAFTIPGGYDATFVDVYVNGVKMQNGVDVDVSSGTDIVFTTAPANGDVIDFIGYGAFQLADMYTKAEIDAGTVVLNGIKNVDGAGSGLDADLLDGAHRADLVEKVNLLSEIKAVDGAGSGIDADSLDGIDSTGFLQTNDIITVVPTLLNGATKDADDILMAVKTPDKTVHVFGIIRTPPESGTAVIRVPTGFEPISIDGAITLHAPGMTSNFSSHAYSYIAVGGTDIIISYGSSSPVWFMVNMTWKTA